VVTERQIDEWIESPVTDLFFQRMSERVEILEGAEFLSNDPFDTFKNGWELAGGVAELRMYANTDRKVLLEGDDE
jgi:hypothetical protein